MRVLTATACAVLLVAGCGRASTPPAADVTEVRRAIVSAPVPAPVPVSPTISVSEDIAQRCRLNLDNVTRAPKFDFDRSDLLPADNEVLDEIARCFNAGDLGWVSLQLVGHADPRGSHAYNLALGGRRARTVALELAKRGVDADRVFELSRGELDAVGTDEATWANDRRVDILTFRPLPQEQ